MKKRSIFDPFDPAQNMRHSDHYLRRNVVIKQFCMINF